MRVQKKFSHPVNLDRSRENSLRFIFFFFFSFIFFDTTSINVVKDVVSRRKHGRVISTNKWNWTVWRTLFRPMGVRSWRKLWKTEVKLPPEGISMVVSKERLQIVVNSCPRFFFRFFPFPSNETISPPPTLVDLLSSRSIRKRLKKNKRRYFSTTI